MQPFNIEKAKAGVPVITRDGMKATIRAFDCTGKYNIVFQVENYDTILQANESGYSPSGASFTLMHYDEDMYVNVYENHGKKLLHLHTNLDEAKVKACDYDPSFIGTYKLVKIN